MAEGINCCLQMVFLFPKHLPIQLCQEYAFFIKLLRKNDAAVKRNKDFFVCLLSFRRGLLIVCN